MSAGTDTALGSTRRLAAVVASARPQDIPQPVLEHGLRALVNFVGCALGGAQHEATDLAETATGPHGGPSTVIGRTVRTTPTVSALLNGLAASAYAFDDTYAHAIVHPGAPVGAALVAACGAAGSEVSGDEAVVAFCWGLEVTCRVAKALSAAPAQGELGWSLTGVAGAIGAAATCAKVLKLPETETTWALGTAAALAGGLRVSHGYMAMHLPPAQAGATGVQAALLARSGFTGPDRGLEGRFGLMELFAHKSAIEHLTDGLGERFELSHNMFKAYPCGIVAHAVIDACLALRDSGDFDAGAIREVELEVPSVSAALADRQQPTDETEALVSLQHWAAVTLMTGRAGVPEGLASMVRDAQVASLRARCSVRVDAQMSPGGARVGVTFNDGRHLQAGVEQHLGSLGRPLGETELSRKFLSQAVPLLGGAAASKVLERCWTLRALTDVREIWPTRPDAGHGS